MRLTVKIAWRDGEQPWCHRWKKALAEGIRRVGDIAEMVEPTECADADVTVTWGLQTSRRRIMEQQLAAGGRHLVMERGYVGDREAWTSLGFDGLNGYAAFPDNDDFSRFGRHFGHLLRPWSSEDRGTAVIMGQIRGDQSIRGVDIGGWYESTAAALREFGWDVLFRDHPLAVARGYPRESVAGATTIDTSLEETLEIAGLVCVYSSNSGVDAALAGVPVFAADRGTMAYPVAQTGTFDRLRRPDRVGWAASLAWRQWQFGEIEDGTAWSAVRALALPRELN